MASSSFISTLTKVWATDQDGFPEAKGRSRAGFDVKSPQRWTDDSDLVPFGE